MRSFFSVASASSALKFLLSLARRANRYRHRRARFRRRQHVTAPVEDSSALDHQARRMDLSGHHALGMNLHAPFGEDHSVKPPGNHDVIAFDLPFDLGVLSQNQALLGADVSLHLTA